MLSPDKEAREFPMPVHGGPAGGGYSSTGDPARFAHGVSRNSFLDSAWTDQLTSGKIDLAPGGSHRYAYGFFVEDMAGLSLVGHGGGGPGINGELTTYRGTGYTIAVLSNIDPPAATNVKRLFDGLLLEATGRLRRRGRQATLHSPSPVTTTPTW